jgi:hypothetical protein
MILKNEVTNEKTKKEPENTLQGICEKNYCDKDGNCTVEDYPDELNCAFCDREILSSIRVCGYRVYFADRCLSPFALVAAREAAAGSSG